MSLGITINSPGQSVRHCSVKILRRLPKIKADKILHESDGHSFLWS
jgi:hypothetical protein